MAHRYQALIDQLADAGATLAGRGLVVLAGGNLSARCPDDDAFVVTATGTRLDRLTAPDFSVVGLSGEVRDGNPHPSSDWRLHQRAYAARPDVRAAVHAHPRMTVLLDALGNEIRLIPFDHAAYVGRIGRVAAIASGSAELADRAARAARDADAIILARHGTLTLGDTVATALGRAVYLEEAALDTFAWLQLGSPDLASPAG